MAAINTLLVVEGPHDIEFVARLLKPGFSRIGSYSLIPSYWQKTIPTKFPVNDNLLARHPVPLFLENVTTGQTVAVVSAVGISQIVSKLSATYQPLVPPPEAVGIILDADSQDNPAKRFADLKADIQKQVNLASLQLAAKPGDLGQGSPKTGIFIMPDNVNDGTLEKVLLEAADINYPELKTEAICFVTKASALTSLDASDKAELNKPAGTSKAHIAAMGAILKPGKAIQTSIQDNRWLEGNSLNVPSVKAVSDFLTKLMA